MTRDIGSRDPEFSGVVLDVRERLLQAAGVDPSVYDVVLMQGSGTSGIESVLSSATPSTAKWLVIVNGTYGRRIADILSVHKVEHETLEVHVDQALPIEKIRQRVAERSAAGEAFSHLAAVHCETTTGIVNDIGAIGAIAREFGQHFFVDAMSSFGGIPISVDSCNVTYLVGSANKCLHGVPGLSFVIAKTEQLEAMKGHARTLTLDVYEQWQSLKCTGQFRFTPPVQCVLGLQQALVEWWEEGGVTGRARRYTENHNALLSGMLDLGFTTYLPQELLGPIITTFRSLDHPGFDLADFMRRLRSKGYVLYPGKVPGEACFRVGTIGAIDRTDVGGLVSAVAETLTETLSETA